jgi:uncharacterized membrane protein YdjX (TVP38/TMEM64 family)
VELRQTGRAGREAPRPAHLTDTSHATYARKLAARGVIITVVFLTSFAIFTLAQRTGWLEITVLRDHLERAGWLGPLLVIAVTTFTSFSATVPSSPVWLLAGALYGPALATTLCFIGSVIGGSIAFGLARLFREPMVRVIGDHIRILERLEARYATATLFISRLIPGISYEVMSYAAGLTTMRYSQFLLATSGVLVSIGIMTTLGSYGLSVAMGENGTGPVLLALFVVTMLFALPIALDHYNPFGWKERFGGPRETRKNG